MALAAIGCHQHLQQHPNSMSNPPNDTTPPATLTRAHGIAALRAGDPIAARRLLSTALIQNPDDLEAWLWLSGAVSSDSERRYCLLRVLALDPAHAAAARGLTMLPDVEPLSPLTDTAIAPAAPLVEAIQPRAEAPDRETQAQPDLPAVTPQPSARRAGRLFWPAVGGLSLVLLALLGLITLRLASRPTPAQPTALVAAAATAAPTSAPTTVTLSSAPIPPPPRPTASPPPTPTSQPSPTLAPPTAEPGATAADTEASAPALAARGLTRERRDDDHDGAMADYTAAIASDPTYADAYYLRAALRYTLGDTRGGEADYMHARTLDSTSAAALYLSGRVEMSRRDSETALSYYNQALAVDSTYAQAYYSRAIYKTDYQYDYAGAVADYTTAIEADPTFAFAYGNRGSLYNQLGEGEAAVRDLTRAIELDPLYYLAYYLRGDTYRWLLGEPRKALEDYRMAVKLRPTSAEAYCELGNVRHALGDAQGGLADTTRAIELDPQYACAYYTRGRINTTLQRYAEAIVDFTRYIELAPLGSRIADAYIGRGIAYANSGQVEEAVVDYTRAIELNPMEPVAYNNRGNCYITLGDLRAAREDLTIAAELYRQQGQMDDYNRVTQKLAEIATERVD